MRKQIYLLRLCAFLAFGGSLQAQVGINTTDPKGTMEISYNSTWDETKPQGLNIPNVSSDQRSKFVDTKVGMLIYNTTKKCIELYQGTESGVPQWQCLPDAGSAQSQNIAVSAAGFEGSYIGGIAFNNTQKTKFKLENNSFGNVSSSFADAVSIQNGSANISISNCRYQKLNGSTLTGSVYSCNSGSLVNLNSGESAMLWYTLSGTPETGVLKADFNKLGAQADQQTAIGLGSATISSPKQEHVISFIYNGTTPATEIQGKINNTTDKLIIKIPYTNGGGSYNAVTSAPVATAAGEGGDTNNLSLSIPAGNFGANGYLEATINVDGDGEYLVEKKAPGEQYEIATIPYTLNGNNYEVKIVGVGGIPDINFGDGIHDYIYMPIVDDQGRTWLSQNLGAEYADINSPKFNPWKINVTDKKAWGSGWACPTGYRHINKNDLTATFKNAGLPYLYLPGHIDYYGADSSVRKGINGYLYSWWNTTHYTGSNVTVEVFSRTGMGYTSYGWLIEEGTDITGTGKRCIKD